MPLPARAVTPRFISVRMRFETASGWSVMMRASNCLRRERGASKARNPFGLPCSLGAAVAVSYPNLGSTSPVARVKLIVMTANTPKNTYRATPRAIMISPEMGPTALRSIKSAKSFAGVGKSQIFATHEAYKIKNIHK